ncbi:MAG: hypothetical protein R2747_09255 [Pyrinomonadaceae bacterium]
MPIWLKTLGVAGTIAAVIASASYLTVADKWGSIFVILALIITLLKQIIAFIGFLTTAIKFLIIFVFIALLVGVGLMVFKAFKGKKKSDE